ncbi:MAG: DNA replication and repair protein RecF [Acidimicrobiia bacterium]|nr:DNA replication and repair protein RecF [Acidimicrobiia bacterium]NNJ46982.1 DNA replication and repair protein RecF [Acidimicrobiia bacterium]
MRLDWIELREFRSYPQLDFRPDPGTNLLVGDNGAGKTNLLEAITYLSTLRSFRKAPDDALIATGSDEAVIRGGIAGPVSEHTIEVLLSRLQRRRVQLDGKRPSRNAELRARLRCVTFLPDDLELTKGSAGQRRGLLDDLAAQLRPTAAADQGDFDRALRQRNALLRAEGPMADIDALASFEAAIATSGASVVAHRWATAAAMKPFLQAAYRSLGPDTVSWRYESAWATGEASEDDLAGLLAAELAARRRQDMERRMTTVGPQRDEPRLLLGDRDSRTHASQGEQRSLVLALRLAAFDLLSNEYDEPPILILDDVFSELDAGRATAIIDRLPGAQAFLSSARHDDVGDIGGTYWNVDPSGTVVEQ